MKSVNMMIQNWNLLSERESDENALHFVDFDPRTVASYYSYIPQLMIDQNLPQYTSLSASPIGTGLLANTLFSFMWTKLVANNNFFFKYFIGITTQLPSYSQYNYWNSYIIIRILIILSISQIQYNTEFSADADKLIVHRI